MCSYVLAVSTFLMHSLNFDFDIWLASNMTEIYVLSYFTSTSEIHTGDFKNDTGKGM